MLRIQPNKVILWFIKYHHFYGQQPSILHFGVLGEMFCHHDFLTYCVSKSMNFLKTSLSSALLKLWKTWNKVKNQFWIGSIIDLSRKKFGSFRKVIMEGRLFTPSLRTEIVVYPNVLTPSFDSKNAIMQSFPIGASLHLLVLRLIWWKKIRRNK